MFGKNKKINKNTNYAPSSLVRVCSSLLYTHRTSRVYINMRFSRTVASCTYNNIRSRARARARVYTLYVHLYVRVYCLFSGKIERGRKSDFVCFLFCFVLPVRTAADGSRRPRETCGRARNRISACYTRVLAHTRKPDTDPHSCGQKIGTPTSTPRDSSYLRTSYNVQHLSYLLYTGGGENKRTTVKRISKT